MAHSTIHKRLKALRQNLGLSQRQLAAEFKVSAGAIAQWESGSRPIPGPVIKLIEVYEETLGTSHSGSEVDEIRHLSTKWSERILVLLKYDIKSSTPIRETLQSGIRKYLISDLPRGEIAKRVRIELLRRVIDSIGLAKGLPMKVLHLLTYMNPGLPEDIRRIVLDLNLNSPAIAPTIVARLIHEEFGATPQKIFAKWNPRPFARASIGQVHEAVLHSGERVAVKVQYPEVEESIRSDFKIFLFLNDVATLLRPENRFIMHDISDTVLAECDYVKEAQNQELFREYFKNDPDVFVPKVYHEYSSRRVLTMDFVEGQHLDKFLESASSDEKKAASRSLWKFHGVAPFCYDIMHADLHAANVLFMKERVALLDFGRVIRLDPAAMAKHRLMVYAIINKDKEAARELLRNFGIVKDWEIFNFDEFWQLTMRQQAHLASDVPFAMSREFIADHQRAMRAFSDKSNLKLSTDLLWSTCMCHGLWALLSDLGACENWGELTKQMFREHEIRST